MNEAVARKNGRSKAVTIREDRSESTNILQVIANAARDPDVDVEKLERLMALHERAADRNAATEFNAAMTACQQEMRPISADATNPQTRSRYASYEQLDRALRPIYTKHGFSISFSDGENPLPDHVKVVATVRHIAGHKETHFKNMASDGKGAKGGDVMTKTHAEGAAQSYGMRYLLKGIFNVAVGEDDNDGNTGETINESQVADLKALMQEHGADEGRFLRLWGIQSLRDVLAVNYDTACRMVRAKGQQRHD